MTQRALCLAAAAVLGLGGALAGPAWPYGETHTDTPVAEPGPRQGWRERTDTVRFGTFSLTVVQRLDPATGLPPPSGQVWGDTFVGIHGRRPAPYMSSNWSPWDFLAVTVRMEGDDRDLPNPTRLGRLTYATIRDVAAERAVAEAAWCDAAGGYLRARLVSRPRQDRFALVLRYFPPPGRRVAAVRYALVCQPYDYADRGHWIRRRWLTTAARSVELTAEPLALDLPREPLAVFHNRYAQTDAGTWLAADPGTVRSLIAATRGQTIVLQAEPAAVDGDAVLVLGDWVDEEHAVASAAFLASAAEVLAEPALARRPVPAPAVPDGEVLAVLELVRRCPSLGASLGAPARAAAESLRRACAGVAAADTPAALAAWSEARREWDRVAEQARAAWVTGRAWTEPAAP